MTARPETARSNGWEHAAIPFEALIWGLGAEAAETRTRAAESLGYRGQLAAVPYLLEALRAPEGNASVRRALYTALGRLGDRTALSDLARCLEKETREELRASCVDAVAAIGDEDSLPKLMRLFERDENALVRAHVVDALGRFRHKRSIALLAELARAEGQEPLRLRALRSLGETGSDKALDPLLVALNAPGAARERAVVIEALGALGNSAATGPLTEALAATRDPALRVRIVIALAAIRDGDAYPALVERLADEVPAVRLYAVRGLRRLGQRRAAGPLVDLYRDLAAHLRKPDGDLHFAILLGAVELQVEVLRALVELDAAVALPVFLDAARLRALRYDSQNALRIAEAIYQRRRLALYGLGYTAASETADLLAGPGGLGDPDPRLRATAVRSLGVLAPPRAAARVLPLLRDPAAEVRWTAAMVLGRLADTTAVPALLERLSDPYAEVRRQATLGLGYLGDPSARPAIARLSAEDPSAEVRSAAAYAAGLIDQRD